MQASPSSSPVRVHAGSRLSRLAVAADASPPRDPFARVGALGMEKHFGAAMLAAAARVAMIHTELLAWTQQLRFAINERLASTYDIEVEKPKPPEPPPEPKEEPKQEKAPPAPKDAPPPPPPAAAQAAKVLTQAPDDAPVDFTNSFVTGNAETYAGGVTLATGTSTTAVRNLNAQPGGVPGGTGTKPAPATPVMDRSRALSLTSRDWHCDFPPEADSEQIDEMVVPTEVSVSASGHVTSARALKDPGYGFARAVVQCALHQSAAAFDVALDRDGNPIPAQRTFNVHFQR
jgi:periplasmic protein TonB